MITKEMLMTASFSSKHSTNYKGVLTLEEAHNWLKERGEIITITNVRTGEFFFTDDHCFGVNVHPEQWVPCTSSIPQEVVPREWLEDGFVDTLEKYMFIFCKGKRIETIDELVVIMNNGDNLTTQIDRLSNQKRPIRVSRLHMGDLESAYLNCPNEKIRAKFDALRKDPGFCVVDDPEPGEFLQDLSIMFLYPHEIKITNK